MSHSKKYNLVRICRYGTPYCIVKNEVGPRRRIANLKRVKRMLPQSYMQGSKGINFCTIVPCIICITSFVPSTLPRKHLPIFSFPKLLSMLLVIARTHALPSTALAQLLLCTNHGTRGRSPLSMMQYPPIRAPRNGPKIRPGVEPVASNFEWCVSFRGAGSTATNCILTSRRTFVTTSLWVARSRSRGPCVQNRAIPYNKIWGVLIFLYVSPPRPTRLPLPCNFLADLAYVYSVPTPSQPLARHGAHTVSSRA